MEVLEMECHLSIKDNPSREGEERGWILNKDYLPPLLQLLLVQQSAHLCREPRCYMHWLYQSYLSYHIDCYREDLLDRGTEDCS